MKVSLVWTLSLVLLLFVPLTGAQRRPQLVLVVVNVETKQDIQTITNHAEVLLHPRGKYTVRVDSLPDNTDSCLLVLDNVTRRVERQPPFALAGHDDENNSDNLFASHALNQPGWHHLYVAPAHTSGHLPDRQRLPQEQQQYGLHVDFQVVWETINDRSTLQADSTVQPPLMASLQGTVVKETNGHWAIYFAGPWASQSATTDPNPYRPSSVFADYRLEMVSRQQIVLPGYYIGGVHPSSTSGNVWKVHVPPQLSNQSFTVRFRQGVNVATFGHGDSAGFMDGVVVEVTKSTIANKKQASSIAAAIAEDAYNLFDCHTSSDECRAWLDSLPKETTISARVTSEIFLDGPLYYNLTVFRQWQDWVDIASEMTVQISLPNTYPSSEARTLLQREMTARFAHFANVLLHL